MLFDKKTVNRLSDNYTPIKKIEILNCKSTNTSNTFNTFWKCIKKNGIHNCSLQSDELTNSEQKSKEYEGNSENTSGINGNSIIDNIRNAGA